MNRSNSQNQPASAPTQSPAGTHGRLGRSEKGIFKGLRVASVALLFSLTVLIVALVSYLVFGGPTNESKYVEDDKLQAVFLNGGQVYFGNIKDINAKYVRLTDIFYLRVNQQVQPEQDSKKADTTQNDISLVKLGCELHRPSNEMLINRDQVVFWENLKSDDGKNTVPGAVSEYVKQFPNGQDCQEATTQTQNTTDTKTDQ